MDGRGLARLSLRADAAYCALTAVCLLVFARALAVGLAVPTWVLLTAAVATGTWAASLCSAAGSARLRTWLAVVLAANVVSAVLVATLAVTRPLDALSLLLLAVAVEVAAFAALQGLALRRV